MSSILIKLLLMPLVVAMVTFISRKWGNEIGGIIASLPWVAGPIMLFIALERGVPFAAATIPGIMVGIVAWLLFCLVYIVVGRTKGFFISMLAGYAAYLGFGISTQPIISWLSVHFWFILVVIVLALGLAFFPKVNVVMDRPAQKLKYDILLRMTMITAFVILLTYFADILGPKWSGILTPFPVMTAVLAVFTHHTQGVFQVRKVFIGLFTGIFGFTVFLYLQHFLLLSTSLFYAFFWAFVVDLIITLALKRLFSKLKLIS